LSESLVIRHARGSYPIEIDAGSLKRIGQRMHDHGLRGPVGIITQPALNEHVGEIVRESLRGAGYATRTVLVPDGERFKTLASAEQIITALLQQGLERGSTILALGGGVMGDLAGFVAAILYRGVPVVQVPTSLLAMVDASIGGKTAVNHTSGKNLIGAFHQPSLVMIDPTVLETLSLRDRVAGYAEMIKLGLVLDGNYLAFLEKHQQQILEAGEMELLNQAIGKACALKAKIVEEDEREGGVRKVLNFGHTLGHAFELVTGYEHLRHGEAVLLGMYGAIWLSHHLKYIDGDCRDRCQSLIATLPLDVDLRGMDPGKVEEATHLDKKVRDGQIQFVLMRGLGSYLFTGHVAPELVREAAEVVLQKFGGNHG